MPHNEGVEALYINFGPDEELTQDKNYKVDLLFMCSTSKHMDECFNKLLDIFGNHNVLLNGVNFSFDVNIPTETRLSELKGRFWFSQWDYLSSLGDVAASLDLR